MIGGRRMATGAAMATNNLPLLVLHPVIVKRLSKNRMLLELTLQIPSRTTDSWCTLSFEDHIYQPDVVGMKMHRYSTLTRRTCSLLVPESAEPASMPLPTANWSSRRGLERNFAVSELACLKCLWRAHGFQSRSKSS